jgi:hypothetical protein
MGIDVSVETRAPVSATLWLVAYTVVLQGLVRGISITAKCSKGKRCLSLCYEPMT